MSNNNSASIFSGLWVVYALMKMGGYFAAWSWWWLLAPIVPFVGAFLASGRAEMFR